MDEQSVVGPGVHWKPVARDRTFQLVFTGATCVVDIEVSNDEINWLPHSQFSLAAPGTDGIASSATWKYVRANVVSISDGTVTVLLGT